MKPGDPITAVITTHRADHMVADCVASLLAQTPRPTHIRVVVSNTPKPLDLPGAEVVQLGQNIGFARAANAGTRNLIGDLLLLNDDITLWPGCLKSLDQARRPGVVLQPRLVLPDGRLDNVGHGFFPDGAIWARGRNGPDVPLPSHPGGFSGAAVLFPGSLWRELGGFDERYDSFGEDVDLSLRLMRRKIPIEVVDARATHQLGASYGRGGTDKIRRIERNRIRAATRSLPVAALAMMPATTLARYALAAGLSKFQRGPGANVDPGAGWAALEGLWEGMTDIPTWWQERQHDRLSWERGERAMLCALWEGRVWARDLFRS